MTSKDPASEDGRATQPVWRFFDPERGGFPGSGPLERNVVPDDPLIGEIECRTLFP